MVRNKHRSPNSKQDSSSIWARARPVPAHIKALLEAYFPPGHRVDTDKVEGFFGDLFGIELEGGESSRHREEIRGFAAMDRG